MATFIHTDACICRFFFTDKFHIQTIFAHRPLYTKKLLRKETFWETFTQSSFHTKKIFTETLRRRNFYMEPLRTETFQQIVFYLWKRLTQRNLNTKHTHKSFCKQKPLHIDVFTRRKGPFHRATFTRPFLFMIFSDALPDAETNLRWRPFVQEQEANLHSTCLPCSTASFQLASVLFQATLVSPGRLRSF